jgi:hypothetical protein
VGSVVLAVGRAGRGLYVRRRCSTAQSSRFLRARERCGTRYAAVAASAPPASRPRVAEPLGRGIYPAPHRVTTTCEPDSWVSDSLQAHEPCGLLSKGDGEQPCLTVSAGGPEPLVVQGHDAYETIWIVRLRG